ncbi:MAG: hypothetical protein ACO33H_06425 [Ilumatobacteraceae bacterium]
MRRRLLAMSATLALVLAACGDASTSSDRVAAPETASTLPAATTTIAESTTTTALALTTTTPPLGTTVVTTVPAPTTTAKPARPRLVVSQTTKLDPAGTTVTVRGTGFSVSKGVYLFVCNQARWDANRRCVGGINMDGSSPLSQWISSNPPRYAEGLTVRFEANGSFSVPLLVRAFDETTNLIDCRVEQCGVVAFADHTRRDDRSQDVFVAISFASDK